MHPIPTLEELIPLLKEVVDQQLLPRFTHVGSTTKTDGSVVTEADLVTQKCLADALQQAWPEIPLLGEEMEAVQQQSLLAEAEYLWCLDPLDGTTNFADGVPIFCTSLALLHRGQAILGIIYDPLRNECFSAASQQGAHLNGKALRLANAGSELSTCIAGVDLKRLDPVLAGRVATEQPFRSQRNFGSGALDWAWLACGRMQLYLHGGQKLWDYMAGRLIFIEAGGVCSDMSGEEIACNALVPRSVVAAANPILYAQWLQWVQG